MTDTARRAAQLTLAAALVGFLLGFGALWLGLMDGATTFWGFGTACLLQVPPALSLRGRIRDGLGNSGLERERLTLRTVSVLMRCLAVGMAMASTSALLGERGPQANLLAEGIAGLAVGLLGSMWFAKHRLREAHPTFALDADRALLLVELAALLLVGSLLSRWFMWADAVAALAMALWLFFSGHAMAKATALPPARTGCGGSCSCG